MEINLQNIESCKAHAYDILAQIEMLQKELQAVNGQIIKLDQEEKNKTSEKTKSE